MEISEYSRRGALSVTFKLHTVSAASSSAVAGTLSTFLSESSSTGFVNTLKAQATSDGTESFANSVGACVVTKVPQAVTISVAGATPAPSGAGATMATSALSIDSSIVFMVLAGAFLIACGCGLGLGCGAAVIFALRSGEQKGSPEKSNGIDELCAQEFIKRALDRDEKARHSSSASQEEDTLRLQMDSAGGVMLEMDTFPPTEDGTRHDDEKHLGPVPAADLHRSLPAIAVPAMHRMESQICAEAVLSSIATNGTIASPVDTEGDSTGVFLDETVKVSACAVGADDDAVQAVYAIPDEDDDMEWECDICRSPYSTFEAAVQCEETCISENHEQSSLSSKHSAVMGPDLVSWHSSGPQNEQGMFLNADVVCSEPVEI